MAVAGIDSLASGGQHSSDHEPLRELLCRGRVVRAPAGITDPVEVHLKNYTSAYPYEVAPHAWEPHVTVTGGVPSTVLPALGDPCLVAFDDEGDAWLVAWSHG